jgi:nitroimidazol reductase NimA-like FMN-containing flavoprotein (pyridoxamine 5'-phosphate oxidase superfamily)
VDHADDSTELSQEELMDLPQGDVRLLQTDVAQRLLVSKELARLAYVAKDGTPRVLPVMFHWNGTEVIICSFAEARKLPALRARPDVAITIDTTSHPPEILLIRGRAELTEVDGVAEEFVLANYRYGSPEHAKSRIDEVDHPGTRMVRIAIRPTWVGVLDFKYRFSGGRTAKDFLQRGRQQPAA